MPILPFNDETFVAFLDISGFKYYMSQADKALEALDRFYQTGYDVLATSNNVDGIFISDCGILFSRSLEPITQLNELLIAVKRINSIFARHKYMLTTSIAFGHFSYHDRLEFQGIEKNPIYGSAYLSAYLDNSNSKNKLQPGQCRILTRNFPFHVNDALAMNTLLKAKGRDHIYFYWNLQFAQQIQAFEELYDNAKYNGIMNAINHYLITED